MEWVIIIGVLVVTLCAAWFCERARSLEVRNRRLKAQVYGGLDVIHNLSMVAQEVHKAKIGNKDEQVMLGDMVDKAWETLHPSDRGDIAYGGIYREEATRWRSIGRSRRGSVSAASKRGSPRRKKRPRKDSRRR